MRKLCLTFFTTLLLLTMTAQAQMSGRYGSVVAKLKQAQSDHPENAEMFSLGVSDSGEEIMGLKVGHGDLENLVVGTHHGNEYGATEVAVGFALDIAAEPIIGQTVYVIPVLNISGYNKNSRREAYSHTTQDPNRDYPGACDTEGPFKLKSTRALAEFVASHNIISSATLHTFSPAVLYPWGISTHDTQTPYEATFKQLGQLATAFSQYNVGNSTEMLYPADGTFEDYAYWQHGVWSLLFEMGNSHTPNERQVQKIVAENVPGLRKFLENSPTARAEDHAFHGHCDVRLMSLDLHNE